MLSLILLFTVIYEVQLLEFVTQPVGDYGPYNVDYTNYGVCRGPKTNDATQFASVLFKEGDSYKSMINITFLGLTSVDEVKLIVFNVKENRKTLLVSYKIDKPCKHFAASAIIAQFTKSTDCIAKKASVSVVINFTDFTHKFFGASFFYGEYYFKALVLSKKGNMLCLSFTTIFSKKM